MKLIDYLKDKMIHLLISLCIMAITFFTIISISEEYHDIALLVLSVHLSGTLLSLIIDWKRKKEFYGNVITIYENLKYKNYISEMIHAPTFMEGAIFYEILKGANKASIEEVNRYKDIQRQYREYIEIWVHEIKTPIASAKLIAHNNRMCAMDSVAEELDKIENHVMQALFYARSNSVEKDYMVREILLKQICNEAIRSNANLLIQNNIAIKMECLDERVFCDAKWIIYIINQLVMNSVQYAKGNNSYIRFYAAESKNYTVLTIEDNGIGVDQMDLPRIFEKSFTGSNGRRGTASTGMGLYICKKLCDKLGLSIQAFSSIDKGLRIEIAFPVNSMTDVF